MWKILLISEILLEAIFTGILPYTKSWLYSALATQVVMVYTYCIYYGLNMTILYGIQATKPFIVLRTALHAREKRTTELTIRNSEIAYTPQRIQEDIKLSYLQRYSAYAEYGISFLILLYLLYMNIAYPSLLVSALLYAGASVLLAYLFNPKLTEAEKMIQNAEAKFRHTLLAAFDPTQVIPVNQANIKAGKIRLGFSLFTAFQMGILSVVPFIIMIPALVSGSMSFQQVIEHSMTFGLIVINAAILISIYPTLIQGKASEQRVRELEDE